MGKEILGRSKTLLCEVKQGTRTENYTKHVLNRHEYKETRKDPCRSVTEVACWIPHPRTGIYYPKGFEWVMEDVPEGAASFGGKYWFRSQEGVEKPAADTSTCDIFNHPYLNI